MHRSITTTEPALLSLTEIAEAIATKRVSSREATQSCLDRIAQWQPQLNAFVAIEADEALAAADAADAALANGNIAGPLHGVPLAHKDMYYEAGKVSTCGSRIRKDWVATSTSTALQRLKAAGTVRLGTLQMAEFAYGPTGHNAHFGAVCNPWNVVHITGGSSSGSGAAVAARLTFAALGSDTGGSIRQPAHVTGTVGIKPTYGGVSRYGAIALASSLDQVGPVTRTVLDAGLLHDVIGGHDPKDSTSLTDVWPSFADAARDGARGDVLKGLRVGVIKELPDSGFQPGVAASFRESLALLEANGAEIVEISTPHFEYGVAAYYLILPAEASSNLAKFDSVRFGLRVTPEGGATVEDVMSATREAGFGDEVKRRIILGTYALSAGYYDAYYGSAQKVRTLIQQDFANAFADVDVIATPSAPTTAFKIGERIDDPLQMYLNDVTTIPANLAGVPGISIPSGLAAEDGLPVGIQFLAPAHEDARLYRVGAALETLLVDSWGAPLLTRAPELAGGNR